MYIPFSFVFFCRLEGSLPTRYSGIWTTLGVLLSAGPSAPTITIPRKATKVCTAHTHTKKRLFQLAFITSILCTVEIITWHDICFPFNPKKRNNSSIWLPVHDLQANSHGRIHGQPVVQRVSRGNWPTGRVDSSGKAKGAWDENSRIWKYAPSVSRSLQREKLRQVCYHRINK